MMTPSNNAINLIKESESLAQKRADGNIQAYPDPAHGWQVPTIGWGSTGPDIKQGTVWTVAQCEDRLLKHINTVAADVAKAVDGHPTSQNQFDALVDFTYNLGIGNLLSSTLLKKHKAGDFQGAANEFPKWNKAGGKVLKGLTTRRLKEQVLYERG